MTRPKKKWNPIDRWEHHSQTSKPDGEKTVDSLSNRDDHLDPELPKNESERTYRPLPGGGFGEHSHQELKGFIGLDALPLRIRGFAIESVTIPNVGNNPLRKFLGKNGTFFHVKRFAESCYVKRNMVMKFPLGIGEIKGSTRHLGGGRHEARNAIQMPEKKWA